MSRRLFAIAVLLSLSLHLRAAAFGPEWQVYLFKPMTTTLIVAMAATTFGSGARYKWLIVAGLVWSLAGDVFLMLPGDRFVPGLASFLVAHLCYIAAFVGDAGFRVTPRLAVRYVLFLAALLVVLLPRLGPLAGPVVVYGAALAVMAWQAAERWAVRRSAAAGGAAVGGVLFLLSDSTLALNRFVKPIAAATVIVMTTYVAAQWLIARSVDEATSTRARPGTR